MDNGAAGGSSIVVEDISEAFWVDDSLTGGARGGSWGEADAVGVGSCSLAVPAISFSPPFAIALVDVSMESSVSLSKLEELAVFGSMVGGCSCVCV